MSWHRRWFGLRASKPGPEAEGRAIVQGALRWAEMSLSDQADAYAATLQVGSTIIEDTDGPEIACYRHLLPGALLRRGLRLVEIAGGWKVVSSPFRALRAWDETPTQIACRSCGRDWTVCGCRVEFTLTPWPTDGYVPLARGPKGRPS